MRQRGRPRAPADANAGAEGDAQMPRITIARDKKGNVVKDPKQGDELVKVDVT